jgi:hypothetical protein
LQFILKRHQINRLTLTQYLAHGTRKDEVQVEEEEDLKVKVQLQQMLGHFRAIQRLT